MKKIFSGKFRDRWHSASLAEILKYLNECFEPANTLRATRFEFLKLQEQKGGAMDKKQRTMMAGDIYI